MNDETNRANERMAEIEKYRLDGARQRANLDGLTRLAARAAGVEQAMITYIDRSHLHSLATVGGTSVTVPRGDAICDAVLHDREPFVCNDLRTDRRFADSAVVRQDLARFWASFQLRTPSGVPIGSLCVFDARVRSLDEEQRRDLADLADRVVDILTLDYYNHALHETVAELRRSNEDLAAFAGQVSHDLQNPLTAVSGTLEMLDELVNAAAQDSDTAVPFPPALLRTAQGMVARASRAVARMSVLVHDLLDLASVGRELHREVVDVQHVMRSVEEDLHEDLRGAELNVDALHPITADELMLRVVLQNMLSNAAKYSRLSADRRIHVWTETSDAQWRLIVRDHGPGIPPEVGDRVFDAFVRADPTVPGTGVGLATCRRIARAHGGSMRLATTPGGGTTIYLQLPRQSERDRVEAHHTPRERFAESAPRRD